MASNLDKAKSFLHMLLDEETEITENLIDNKINWLLSSSNFNEVDYNELKQSFLYDIRQTKEDPTLLTNKEVKPWLKSKKSKISWDYWERYKLYMKRTKPEININGLDYETDKILDQMMDPTKDGAWLIKGLVVGHIQSGKTANYIGLINKAADAGYRFIVVIAGIHNSLRAQTQSRIDRGFIGKSSRNILAGKSGGYFGVGEYLEINGKKIKDPYSFTSNDVDGDFNSAIASRLTVPINSSHPVILVIKKEKSILENLISWLKNNAKTTSDGKKFIPDLPLLLIDDEADHASVDTKKEIDKARTINRHIRTLLSLFEKRTYVGYTATPFANLFIPEEWSREHQNTINGINYRVGPDLFPENFIVNLQAPPQYIGAKRVFGFQDLRTGKEYEGLDLIEIVKDLNSYLPKNLNKKNVDELPENKNDVPPSLIEAIKFFVLSSAIRRLRGQDNDHHSMLVHVSRFKIWINRFAKIINELVKDIENELRAKDETLLKDLKFIYDNKIKPVTEEVKRDEILSNHPMVKYHDWSKIKNELFHAVSKIEVKAIHGNLEPDQKEELDHRYYDNIGNFDYDDYENGATVIAVGGDKMSRGLTLEGLSVSYFLRTSKLYDSLMQMGRWLGYKPGYVDLCKLYTTKELSNWYRHVTLATEVMRDDFDDMASKRKTPKDYQLKVMTHPSQLSITGSGKLREFELINLSFSGRELQTYELSKKYDIIKKNIEAFEGLLNKMVENSIEYMPRNSQKEYPTYIWKKVPPDFIKSFIYEYKSDQPNLNREIIKNYIDKQEQKDKIKDWSVILMNSTSRKVNLRKTPNDSKKNNAEAKRYTFNTGTISFPVKMLVRNDIGKSRNYDDKFLLQKNAIMGTKDRFLDLNTELIKQMTDNKNLTKKIADEIRSKEQKGALIIYPIDPRSSDYIQVDDMPIIGFALIFPKLAENEQDKVEFAVRYSYNPDEGWEDEFEL